MDPQHVNDVVARVVAWHNRHPLAWRIAPGHVASVGLVALPFYVTGLAPAEAAPDLDPLAALVAPDDLGTAPTAPMQLHPVRRAIDDDVRRAALRGPIAARLQPLLQRLRRRAPEPGFTGRVRLLPAYSEDFIPPLLPRETARWALRQGWPHPPGERGWPCREIGVDPDVDAPADAELTTLYLVTAAVEFGGFRLRLLIGRGRTPPVCGARALRRGRLAGAAGGLVLAGTAGALVMLRPAWLDAVPTLLARADRNAPAAPGHDAPPAQPASSASQSPAGTRPEPAHGDPPASASEHAAVSSAPSDAHDGILTERADGAPVNDPSVDPARQHDTLDPGADLRRRRAAAYAAARASKAGPPTAPTASPKPESGAAPGSPPAGKSGSPTAVAAAQPSSPAAELEPRDGQDDEAEAPPLVHILPTLSPVARHAARIEAAALRGQDPDSLAIGRPLRRGSAAAKAMPGEPAASAPGSDRLYALVTRRTPTRVESEALLVTLRVAVARDDTPMPKRQDLLEVENGWQAAWWPFKSRDEAERARRLLATRGLQLEVVDF